MNVLDGNKFATNNNKYKPKNMNEKKDITSILTPNESMAMRYFTLKYECFPNEISIDVDLDCRKFDKELIEEFGENILERYTEEQISTLGFDENGHKNENTLSADYVLSNETFISINWRGDRIMVYFKSPECTHLDKLLEVINKSSNKKDDEANFYMLSNDGGYLSLRRMNFKFDDKYSISDLYNDDLIEKKEIVDDFLHNAKSGLMLFHGNPGTGKTSFIKSLIRQNESTKFIYMPNQMFSQLEAPSFINFFANHQDSIIVIEDAEALLTERKEGNTSISTLLNLTDGMLGEALRIKVVCTFNCDINQIDSALKRKGRLKFSYDFKELSLDKTNALLIKTGHKHISKEPMVLTDIINFEIDQYEKEEKPTIGFTNRK